jgi:hypothetical protein
MWNPTFGRERQRWGTRGRCWDLTWATRHSGVEGCQLLRWKPTPGTVLRVPFLDVRSAKNTLAFSGSSVRENGLGAVFWRPAGSRRSRHQCTDSDTQRFDTIHEPQYQTLSIAKDASGDLKVLSSLPELIVPRQDGFWHVGVKQFCEFNDIIEDGGNENLRQLVSAAPAMQAAAVKQSHPCGPHKPEDYAPPDMRAEQDKDKISQSGFELVNLLYVSPQSISASTYTGLSEDSEARCGRYTIDFEVRNFDSDAGLSFGELLGSKAHDAYLRALPNQGQGDAGEE